MIIVGLGNTGEEYEGTRHNAGRDMVFAYGETHDFPDFVTSKKHQALIAKGGIGKRDVLLMLPETFMNKSGSAVKTVVTSAKKAKDLVVVYDDFDVPFGMVRVAFGRGSGGHKGIESVIRGVGTKDFVRVRVGVMPTTPTGKPKKPQGENAVVDFLLGRFSKKEDEGLTKVEKRVHEILDTIAAEGYLIAMNEFNGK